LAFNRIAKKFNTTMSGIFLLLLVLAAIVYLMYALLYPEKF